MNLRSFKFTVFKSNDLLFARSLLIQGAFRNVPLPENAFTGARRFPSQSARALVITRGFMARILLVSYIPELLQERERVLREAGYEVTLGPSYAAACMAIDQETFDVAVLGFSVPEEERNQMARALKAYSSSTQIIMIYFASVENTELADALIPTSAGAEDVLRAVNHIISKRREHLA